MAGVELSEVGSGSVSHRTRPILLPLVRSSLRNLVQRILLLALLFTSELVALSVWLDSASLLQRHGLIGIIGTWGAWILRFIVGFSTIFLTFAYLGNKAALEKLSGQMEQTPVRWWLFAAHFCAMGVFVFLSSLLYGHGEYLPQANLLAAAWFAAGITAIAFASVALLSWTFWAQLVRCTGYLWAYASTAAFAACFVGNTLRGLWRPASYLTLHLTKMLLSPFVSGVIANPATMTIGTQRFNVQIAPQCSGLEGVGLILAFGILWLLVFRKEYRFPRSLVLLPLGVTLIFFLNSVRIAALILIGNAGAEQIALGGFHSQAGWIAFSAVSVGFCVLLQRVSWFTTGQPAYESHATTTQNPTSAFLLPFLAILAAGMIAGTAKAAGGVEWLYPLRFFAAAGILWIFRRSYANLNWRCGWLAPVIGAVVFVLWVGLRSRCQSHNRSGIFSGFDGILPSGSRHLARFSGAGCDRDSPSRGRAGISRLSLAPSDFAEFRFRFLPPLFVVCASGLFRSFRPSARRILDCRQHRRNSLQPRRDSTGSNRGRSGRACYRQCTAGRLCSRLPPMAPLVARKSTNVGATVEERPFRAA